MAATERLLKEKNRAVRQYLEDAAGLMRRGLLGGDPAEEFVPQALDFLLGPGLLGTTVTAVLQALLLGLVAALLSREWGP